MKIILERVEVITILKRWVNERLLPKDSGLTVTSARTMGYGDSDFEIVVEPENAEKEETHDQPIVPAQGQEVPF